MSITIYARDGAAMDEEAATKTWAVISQAAISILLALFQRVDWPLNKSCPGGKCFLVAS
jgi:hypothetical protein